MFFRRKLEKLQEKLQTEVNLLENADNPEYIKTLTEDQRKWLKDFAVKSEIDTCMSCPCFSWDYDENKKMKGYICTIGGEPSLGKKGKCE